ncbi:MAG: hypothetical protein ABSH06_12990 [Thermodesulfobacteriota bacterium]
MITVWRKFYKLARPDGWDFPSGKTINYRDNIGKVINCYRFNRREEFFGEAFARASRKPDQAWFRIPCSGQTLGMLITIFTNMFTGSQDHDRIVPCHARRDWMRPGPFIM